MPATLMVLEPPANGVVTSPGGAASFLPRTTRPTLSQLRAAARTCQGCELYLRGTQTVFGAGAAHADVAFVGEQPGDQEDLQGKPFVGPAGRILDKGLVEAGIEHSSHLLLAIPEGFEAGGIADTARKLKPDLNIIARAHSQEEVKHLLSHGATSVIMGEEEIAKQMLRLLPA